MKQFTLRQLADQIGAQLVGADDYMISGLAPIQAASEGQLSFLANPSYQRFLATTGAGAVILQPAMADQYEGHKLILDDPYFGYAQISHLFDPRPQHQAGIHPTAYCADDAVIDPSASIGPRVVVEAGARIGAGTRIDAGTVIGERTIIGCDTYLAANVTVCHGVIVGDRVIINSGAVIGSDGFGFANKKGEWHKIAQIGTVVIGNDVDIGANTTIDRGALGDTLIADGVKIDNLVQIAHNVSIGEHSAIAGCVGIAGSTSVGRYCTLAGGAGLAGHLTLGDRVHVSGMSLVSKSLPEAGAYSSGAGGCMPSKDWRKQVVRFRQLDEMSRRLRRIEKTLSD